MRNMNENTIQTFRTSSRTAECDVVVLKETSSTRLVFRPQIVDNPSNPEACVNGHLFHQKKTRNGLWEDAESLNLSTLKSGEGVRITLHSAELMLLKDALDKIYALGRQGLPFDGHYAVVRDDDVLIIEGEEQDYIRELLSRNLGENVWQQLIELEPDLATKLAWAKVQSDRMQVADSFELNMLYGRNEKFWQVFLSKNDWIFGYGLTYYCMTTLGREILVGGKNINNSGGQVCDFLLRTNGNARFTSLVEIKCPNTKLIQGEDRNGVYPISRELAAAVSQIQIYCNSWGRNRTEDAICREIEGDYLTVSPKGILVIGDTSELDNKDKRISFELFRRSLHNIDIITYDELLERARFIVNDKQELEMVSTTDASSEFISDDELPF